MMDSSQSHHQSPSEHYATDHAAEAVAGIIEAIDRVSTKSYEDWETGLRSRTTLDLSRRATNAAADLIGLLSEIEANTIPGIQAKARIVYAWIDRDHMGLGESLALSLVSDILRLKVST